MREDMSKLLVERPRRRGSKKRNRRHPLNAPLSRDGEDVSKLSMKKSWISHKELNENLAPLDRYLRSQVGRLWDDVYSDICQHLNRNSAVQYHVFQHLAHMVDLDLNLVDGKVRSPTGYGPSPGELYVHPTTGRLCCQDRKPSVRRSNKNSDVHKCPSNPLVQYHRIEGVWYEIALVPFEYVEKKSATPTLYDVLTKKRFYPIKGDWGCYEVVRRYGGLYRSVRKTQMNSQEIRRILV